MKTLRVTFKNFAKNDCSRMLDELKNIYWQKGKEPENWENFDGDITVEKTGDRGGDCFILELNEENFKEEWILKNLVKNSSIRFIEEKKNSEFVQLFKRF